MANILVAEDEPAINKLITQNLKLVGHTADQAFDGETALQMAREHSYDLILLDVMLPKLTGFEMIEKMKKDIPVIFVTAKSALSYRLEGLDLGAEDYIIKPFEMLELLARVRVVLRRSQKDLKNFTLVDTIVDLDTHQVWHNNEEVALTPREFDLLETFITNRNLALSRDKLLQLVWGYDYEGDTRTVDVHVQRLRKKLGWENEIKTVYKMGYRLQTKGTSP